MGKNGENDIEVTKAPGDQALKKDNGDKANKSSDIKENVEKNGENDIKVTKAPGDQALKKDNGDEANKSSDIKENVEKDDQGSKSEQNNDAEMSSSSSSSSSDEDDGSKKGPTYDENASDIEMNPPTKKDLSMLKNIAMGIFQKKVDGHRQKYIQAQTGHKIMRLLEI